MIEKIGKYFGRSAALRSAVVVLLVTLLFNCAHAPSAEGKGGNSSNSELIEKTMEWQHLKRVYYVYLPHSYSKTPMPLLLSLHGGDGTALAMASWSRLNDLADKFGFIAVYPQGYDKHWQDGRRNNLYGKIDDVGFIQAVITSLSQEYLVNTKKVYAVGYSNGGFMVQRLACEIPAQITAVCSICASRLEDMTYSPTVPEPIMFILGTADPYVPFNGGPVLRTDPNAPGVVYSAAQTIQFWLQYNSCTSTGSVIFNRTYPDKTTALVKFFQSPDNNDVEFCTITGGGHTWPGVKNPLPPSLLGVTSPFGANASLWSFFSSHSK